MIVTIALKLLVLVWILLAVGCVFVMTLGTDEAWVLNGLRSALRPQVPHLSTEVIVTSGGAFALANLVVEQLAGNQVWAHRLVSLIFLGLSITLIMRAGCRKSAPTPVKWLMLTPMLAIPGAAEVGTAALGTATGLALMVAAMVVWTSVKTTVGVRIVGGGLLYGLAAASRFELVLFGVSVIIAGCLIPRPTGRVEIKLNLQALGLAAIGITVFALNLWIMSLTANPPPVEDISGATGLREWSLNYPKLLNHWSTASLIAPLSTLAVMAASALWTVPAEDKDVSHIPRLESILLLTGVILFAAWIFRAPIPHLRYAFPAMFCFAALGSIGLQKIAEQSFGDTASSRHWLICQLIGVSLLICSIGTSARSLVMSDSDYSSWEWSQEMPHDYFRRFDAKMHQDEVAEYLRNQLPSDARIYSYIPYALRYLVDRPIIAVDRVPHADHSLIHANRFLVLTPAVGTYLYMNQRSAAWIEQNTQLVKQIGRFSIYRLPDGTDSDLTNLMLRRTDYERHPKSNPWFGRKVFMEVEQ